MEPDISIICDWDKLTERGCTGAPDWIINYTNQTIFIYFLEETLFEASAYNFQDVVKLIFVMIYILIFRLLSYSPYGLYHFIK